MRRRFDHRRVQEWIAVLRARRDGNEIALRQGAPRRRATTRGQFGEPAGPLFVKLLPRRALGGRFLQRFDRFRRQLGHERLDPKPLLETGIGAPDRRRQHAHERGGQRHGIILRQPLAKLDQAAGEKCAVAQDRLHRLDRVLRGKWFRGKLDDIAGDFAAAERHADLRAQDDASRQRFRNLVIEGAVQGNFGNDAGEAGHGRFLHLRPED